MADAHRGQTRTFRPDQTEYGPAQRQLDARGHDMTAFLRACLRWVDHDADAALTTLGPFWPDARPRGAAAYVDCNPELDDTP